jgi:uncharacterized protein
MNPSLDQLRRQLLSELPRLKAEWSLATIQLFGSRVRNEGRPDSDLDVLVTFEQPLSLFRFIELELYLTDLLGVKVDLVMRDSLKPRIGKRILAEAVSL